MHRYATALSLLVCVGTGVGACKREPKMTTGTEVQTQSVRPAATPATVSGCLKAGEAEGTYVLTVARAEGAREPATYQLVGDPSNFRDHIGRRVEVDGTIEVRQEVATRSTAQSADQRPTGTSGTPTVQTRSEIEITRFSVNSVKPLGDKCD